MTDDLDALLARIPATIQRPTDDANGGRYQIAYRVALGLGLSESQFYALLHCAVLRTDEQVAEWDERERLR